VPVCRSRDTADSATVVSLRYNRAPMHSGRLPPSYPHLDVRLQQLGEDALHFWGDSTVRERALRDILDAYASRDSPRLDAALLTVDNAVVAGMRALGFARAPIAAIRARQLFGALGQKSPSCNLDIDVVTLRRALAITGRPDSVIETWVHESAHGRRRPWNSAHHAERANWNGYEEGLAEGLAKEVARLGALSPGEQAYVRYRRGYELLADALRIPREELYRRLWGYEVGAVRLAFTDAVDDLYHQSSTRRLSLQARRAVRELADEIFDTSKRHQFDRAFDQRLRRAWRRRLP
jgi:hypothetical protein